jgi:hypothetical protein
MATNRGDATPAPRPGAGAANATPPRDASAVAPEAKAQAARETTSDATPATAPRSAAAPAKSSGPSPESKQKAARRTTAPRRAKATRPPRTAANRPAGATTPARARAAATRATAAAGTSATPALPRLAAVTAAPAPTAPTAAPTTEAGEHTGHDLGRFNVDLVEAGRSAGRTVVEAVEGAGDRLAAYHEQVAGSAPLPWVAEIARANADLTRAATRAYVGTVRSLLKA